MAEFEEGLDEEIVFEAEISATVERTRSLSNKILFETRFSPTQEGELQSTVQFDVAIGFGEAPASEIAFDATAEATAGKGLSSELDLDAAISRTIQRTRSLENEVSFGASCIAWLGQPSSCDLREYDPATSVLPSEPARTVRDYIELICADPSLTLTLRAPDLGDICEMPIERAFNRSRNGSLEAYRGSFWGSKVEFEFTVDSCDSSKREEVLNFYTQTLGRQVTYVDYESRSWVGILIAPDNPIMQSGRYHHVATFRFRGQPA